MENKEYNTLYNYVKGYIDVERGRKFCFIQTLVDEDCEKCPYCEKFETKLWNTDYCNSLYDILVRLK